MLDKPAREPTEAEYLEGSINAIKKSISPLIVRLSKVKHERAELGAKKGGLTTKRWKELCGEEDLLAWQVQDAIDSLENDAHGDKIRPRVRNEIVNVADALYHIFLDSVARTEEEYLIPEIELTTAHELLNKYSMEPILFGQTPRGKVLQ